MYMYIYIYVYTYMYIYIYVYIYIATQFCFGGSHWWSYNYSTCFLPLMANIRIQNFMVGWPFLWSPCAAWVVYPPTVWMLKINAGKRMNLPYIRLIRYIPLNADVLAFHSIHQYYIICAIPYLEHLCCWSFTTLSPACGTSSWTAASSDGASRTRRQQLVRVGHDVEWM